MGHTAEVGASARHFGNRPFCPHARLAQSHRDYTNDGISLETAVSSNELKWTPRVVSAR